MIYNHINRLISYALKKELIIDEDIVVVRNELMEILHLTDFEEKPFADVIDSIDDILKPIVDYACEMGIIADTTNSRDLFDTRIMGIFTAMPHEINSKFNSIHAKSPSDATNWYYKWSSDINYVRKGRISKDLKWTYECEYGTLDITINRSKPEKDPRDIALQKASASTAYPKCALCLENAGFPGDTRRPARQNLRPVSVKINGEKWALQYSPYGYYNEHCIIFNQNHVPMKIDSSVFLKLLDAVDFLPHYFVGSNADLPIVGGSILSHEHFQGGSYTFAMATAKEESRFSLSLYPEVKAARLKWPMSVIRLTSSDRNQLAGACNAILEKWRIYNDESVGIIAFTDETPHNTITPIVRKLDGIYECDLVLRNNRTSPERPLGIFHPKPSIHHIKKENIGLIEVMGLAVLPARLAEELATLEKMLVDGNGASDEISIASHREWAEDILRRRGPLSPETIHSVIEEEVGAVFLEVLEDAGVFKRNDEGILAFDRFISTLQH